MKIILKCGTPDHYKEVTHAVIEFNSVLVESLLAKLDLAERLQVAEQCLGNHFMGLQYRDYTPYFINLGDPTAWWIDDDALDDGYLILPANLENHEWTETSMRPVMLMAMASGRIYWYGYDKHGDAGCRAETYSLHEKDLRNIAQELEKRNKEL